MGITVQLEDWMLVPDECPVSMDIWSRERCGLPLHAASFDVDPYPVCLMHSIDPAKQEGQVFENFWRQLEDMIAGAGENRISFYQYQFPRLSFGSRKLVPACDFTLAKFTQEADFSGVTFTRDVKFNYAKFMQAAKFKDTVFTENADFTHATFTEDVAFENSTFTLLATFEDAIVLQKAYFHSAVFMWSANFREATFTGSAYFTDATFRKSATFKRVQFMDDAVFIRAVFSEVTNFANATFTQIAHFNQALFTQDADFEYAAFKQRALFVETRFLQAATFRGAEFEEIAGFANVVFTGRANYSGSNFRGEARWEGCRFLEGAEFRQISFKSHSPHNFYFASFARPEEILFDAVDLSFVSFENCDVSRVWFTSSVSWGRLDGRRAVLVQETSIYDGSKRHLDYKAIAQIYQQLKKNYDNRLDYWTANEFHFGEMEMQRLDAPQEGSLLGLRQWWHRRLSLVALYRWGSSYGNSFQRPLWWLAAVLLVFAVLFPTAGLSHVVTQGAGTRVWVETFVSAWRSGASGPQKAASLLGVLGHGLLTATDTASFQRNIEYAPVYPWGRVLAIAETLLTSTLVALFFLALKRQFRR